MKKTRRAPRPAPHSGAPIERRRWLVLLLQLPARPDYVRVRVGRILQSLGAVALKNGVYALPENADARERMAWLSTEVAADGGEALVLDAWLAGGLTDAALVDRFRKARSVDWSALAAEIRAADLGVARSSSRMARSETLRRLARFGDRRDRIAAIDFFDSIERDDVERLLARLDARLRSTPGKHAEGVAPIDVATLRGRTWTTQPGVREDRIASAWLIRRFVDPRARFRFAAAEAPKKRNELRFDAPGGDFTHEGDRCTMEVLVERLGIDDAALRALAEIVHDVDLGDGKFDRPETPGFAAAIRGLVATEASDEKRLERGFALLDALHVALAGSRRPREKRR